MKFGTKLNHLIKVGTEIADEHEDCAIHVDLKGTIDAYGNIVGAHTLTLERPGQTIINNNVTIETMITLAQDFKRTLG